MHGPLHLRHLQRLLLTGLVLGILALPGAAWAQSTISGVVTDATGAVLPGVTVEASSPVLIEKARSAVTDGTGRYSIVDLRPGPYSVTFVLQGFNTVKRDAIEVAANVSVPLNAELRVGALEEAITVTGETPVVDVQQAGRRQVLNRELLETLPTARTYVTAGAIVPGVKLTKPDMGGTGVVFQSYLRARGKSHTENAFEVEGIDTRSARDQAGNTSYTNFAMTQDVVVQTSAISAESASGGVRINMIPREGGNTFKGDLFVAGVHRRWQSSNITPELTRRGLATPDATDYLYEVNPALGGPLVRDRLWFFGSPRLFRINLKPAGAHYADGSPGFNLATADSASLRLTWQASAKNKIVAIYDRSFKGEDHIGRNPEVPPGGMDWATAPTTYKPGVRYYGAAKWAAPLSNRLLIEGGGAIVWDSVNVNDLQPGVARPRETPEWYANAARLDFVRGTLTHGSGGVPFLAYSASHAYSSAVSYVTGSHAFKTGVQGRHGFVAARRYNANADLTQRYRDGRPDAVDVYPIPSNTESVFSEVGWYAQDVWTIKRLTMNPGIRIDYYHGGIAGTSMPPGRFIPARSVEAFDPLPDWVDVSPRLSAAYDLFGNARTALKFSANKYLAVKAADFPGVYNPIGAPSDRRNWFDCDLNPGTSTCSGRVLSTNGDDIAQDTEIGPSNNVRFGLAAPRRADPDLNREYNWDFSVGVQHQLLPRVSVNAATYYTRFYNLQGARNVLRSPSDYAPFQVENPLTGELITVYNLNRAKQGLVDIVDTTSDINRRTYRGYELGIEGRLPKGGTVLAGWFGERLLSVTCDVEDPNRFRYCDQTGTLHQELGPVPGLPFRHEFKFGLVYPLPRRFEVGLSVLSYPGEVLDVVWAVPPNVFPGGRTEPVTVSLVPPGTRYLERWNQVDINFKRSIRVGHVEMRPSVDIYNLLNSSVVLTELQTFGAALGRPTSMLQGRFVKLGALLKF
jgi:hypothetical protein